MSNAITGSDRAMMQAYAARDYIDDRCRTTNYVEVNVPEYTPTLPQNAEFENLVLQGGYFVNSNFPVTQSVIKAKNFLTLPIMKGQKCPTTFRKGTIFLLFYPTGKIEEGRVMFMTYPTDVED